MPRGTADIHGTKRTEGIGAGNINETVTAETVETDATGKAGTVGMRGGGAETVAIVVIARIEIAERIEGLAEKILVKRAIGTVAKAEMAERGVEKRGTVGTIEMVEISETTAETIITTGHGTMESGNVIGHLRLIHRQHLRVAILQVTQNEAS